MTQFVADHRDVYGVEPICRVLQIAPSTFYDHAARQADPELRSNRWWQDKALCEEIRRVWDENRQVYGVRKIWKHLLREGRRVNGVGDNRSRSPNELTVWIWRR